MQSQPVIDSSHRESMRFASSRFLKIETAVLARKPNGNARLMFTEHAVVWFPGAGGGERDRTDDLLLAKQALSQLSYTPEPNSLVGLDGFEPSTPALSRRCSNQLSYRPRKILIRVRRRKARVLSCSRRPAPRARAAARNEPISVSASCQDAHSRKEVIQPHLPIRLPCYDFTPVMNLTVVAALLAVRQTASGETHSHGVTGGVYKTRERIHRDMLIRDY
jgi:hypothetical protein